MNANPPAAVLPLSAANESTLIQWLSMAYGADQAAEAWLLPTELRYSLYHDVLTFGPAGEQIRECLERVEARIEQDDYLRGCLARLQSSQHQGLPSKEFMKENYPRKIGATQITSFKTWVSFENYTLLDMTLRETANVYSGSTLNPDVKLGLKMLLWMLNGQYLFPPGFQERVSVFRVFADEVLDYLGMPALSCP